MMVCIIYTVSNIHEGHETIYNKILKMLYICNYGLFP